MAPSLGVTVTPINVQDASEIERSRRFGFPEARPKT